MVRSDLCVYHTSCLQTGLLQLMAKGMFGNKKKIFYPTDTLQQNS